MRGTKLTDYYNKIPHCFTVFPPSAGLEILEKRFHKADQIRNTLHKACTETKTWQISLIIMMQGEHKLIKMRTGSQLCNSNSTLQPRLFSYSLIHNISVSLLV